MYKERDDDDDDEVYRLHCRTLPKNHSKLIIGTVGMWIVKWGTFW